MLPVRIYEVTSIIQGEVGAFVADLKQQPGLNIIKYGNGALDDALFAHNLIDEYHFLLTPPAVGRGQHLFENVQRPPI